MMNKLAVKKTILLVSGLTFTMGLVGCAGIKTNIDFSKGGYGDSTIVKGHLKGSFSKVQEFRSLLESLEYRVSEKAK